jgi:hypothetical protein
LAYSYKTQQKSWPSKTPETQTNRRISLVAPEQHDWTRHRSKDQQAQKAATATH